MRKHGIFQLLVILAVLFCMAVPGFSAGKSEQGTGSQTQSTATQGAVDELPALARLPKSDLAPINISVFIVNSNFPVPPEDNRAMRLIKEKLGVTFTWDIAVAEKDQKIGVMIAGGDYPDLLHIDSPKFIDAGAVIPLEDLIEKHAPNLKRHYQSDPVTWAKMHEKDGHVYTLLDYGVPENGDVATDYYGPAMFIQKQVLKEFGYPKIKTIDEYFDLIARYKAKYPTTKDGKPTIGFSILTHDWRRFNLVNPPQFLAGYPNDGDGIVDPVTVKYRLHYYGPEAKRWYKLLNEMNQKGLIDRESFVDTYDQYMAKLANGQILGVHDQYWNFQEANKSLVSQGRIWETMMPLPIVFDKDIKPHYRDTTLPNLQRGYGISVNAKDPVRIIKFLDMQLDPEWQKIFQWGVEGIDYTIDADGQPSMTPEQSLRHDDVTWRLHNLAELWWSEAPKLEGHFPDGLACAIKNNKKLYQATLRPEDVEVLNAYGAASWSDLMDPNPPANPPWYPAWQISPSDGSPEQLAFAKAQQIYVKDLPRIILANPADFEKEWANYVNELQQANIKVFEAFIQAGIDDRMAQFGKGYVPPRK
jgi:putative aldouronate transport system substrate-binding protein